MTEKSHAKEILAKIVSSACTQSKVDEGPFKIRLGGKTRRNGLIDWYVNVRPTDFRANIRINTRQAKEVDLLRTRFGIVQAEPKGKLQLVIYEWDGSKDWKQDYRTIFEKDAHDPKAIMEMTERMRAIISGSARTLAHDTTESDDTPHIVQHRE